MANEDYKNGKLVEIVREFNNTGNQYEVNGIKQAIAVPFWRRENDKFQVIPKGSYSFINEAGNDYLKILDSTILQQATQFQIVYDYLQLSSKYIEDFPDVVVLTEKYNQLVDDTTNLFSYLKSVGMISDTLQLTKVLAQLEPLTTWYMNENGEIKALPINELYVKFQGLINKLYDEIKKLTSIYADTLKNELKKNAEQIINNIAEQKTSMKLQPNITRYQLPSTWIITDKTEVYINGLLISKEMYRIENYELILNEALSDEADLVIKISLPSTYIEELKNTAKEDIDNYIAEKKKELKGDKGTTFKPNVDNLGNLTWSNDDGLPNPSVTNIMGPQGKPGVPGRDGEQGKPGKNGEDGKDLTVEVQGTIGMKFDEKLRFLNDVGVKKKGLCYFDKLTNRAFECLNDTDLTVNDIRYFKDISNKHNIDYIAGLFENTKLYDINSNPINDNFFKGKVTKIIGVKIDVEANDFLNSENKLIKFNYKKVMNQCCYANIICTRPTKSHLGSSLENKVFARIQKIDSVEITIGVLNNNKKEKVEIFLVLYGD